ncbi:hypothetical protein KTAU_30920 [Thermogemmatispora aurantia]|nr:hypothetical protein KTAU_30920 [Thermogemmatispora aurantia]
MSHQARQPFISLLAKKQRPIHGMETCVPESGSIAHVMQIRCRDQMPGIIWSKEGTDAQGHTGDPVHVKPT